MKKKKKNLNILVAVRKRPILSQELLRKEIDIVETDFEINQLILKENKIKYDMTKFIQQHVF